MSYGVGGRQQGRRLLRDAENVRRDWIRPEMAEHNPVGYAYAVQLARAKELAGIRYGGHYVVEVHGAAAIRTTYRPTTVEYDERLDDLGNDERPALKVV